MENPTKTALDKLTFELIGAAIYVHKTLGPGQLESIYHECMKIELEDRGIKFKSEYKKTMVFKGRVLTTELRCDLLVEDLIIVELKAASKLLPIHDAQVLSYMKLFKVPKGILINFHCTNLFREGQQTFVNELFRALPA